MLCACVTCGMLYHLCSKYNMLFACWCCSVYSLMTTTEAVVGGLPKEENGILAMGGRIGGMDYGLIIRKKNRLRFLLECSILFFSRIGMNYVVLGWHLSLKYLSSQVRKVCRLDGAVKQNLARKME